MDIELFHSANDILLFEDMRANFRSIKNG